MNDRSFNFPFKKQEKRIECSLQKSKEIDRRLTIEQTKKDLTGETGAQRRMEGGDFIHSVGNR